MSSESAKMIASVLVIDDDPDILEVVSFILNTNDFPTTTARGGIEALARLREGPLPRLIVLDMMMPEMNGWAFRSEQLNDPALADIPVVVLTADGNAREKAKAIGAVAHLKKPLDMDDLLSVVGRYCPLR